MEKIRNLFYLITSIENFYLVLFEYFFPKQNQLIKLKTRKDQVIYCRAGTTDYHEVISVLSGKDYPMKKYLNLGNNPIIVDIGAFIGDFDLYCKTLYSESTIFAFEPNPSNFKMLNLNIKSNNIKNIFLINQAVSNKTGMCKLYFQESNQNEGNIYEGTNFVDVKQTNLEIFCKKYKLEAIDILKLDCEGAEFDILSSLPKNVSINNLVIEYHLFKDSHALATIESLLGKSYQLIYHNKNNNLDSGIAFFKMVTK